ncbi:MAG: hypothetical protein WAV90_00425 [Gordonia amarae]
MTKEEEAMEEQMENAETETETVEELTPDSRGRWLVTTMGSRHIFDLDRGNYTRIPGAGRGDFIGDGEPQKIYLIGRWPRLGESFYVEFDDPASPWDRVQTRLSSTVQRIERLTDNAG